MRGNAPSETPPRPSGAFLSGPIGELTAALKGIDVPGGRSVWALTACPWKGNVRELANAVEYAVNARFHVAADACIGAFRNADQSV